MSDSTQSVTVIKGDSAWSVAKRNLSASNQNVTNDEIIEEMQRLAKLNNCNSVDDFANKFFSSAGKKIITDKPKKKTQVSKNQKNYTPSNKYKPANHVEQANSTRITPKPNFTAKSTHKFQLRPEAVAKRINAMSDNKQRIIEYNKTNYNGKYYGIVDKKSCTLCIYDKKGNVVKTYPVGVGKSIGDGLAAYFTDTNDRTKDAYKGEKMRFTTAGEYTLDEIQDIEGSYRGRKDNKVKLMYLKGDNRGYHSGQLSLHMIYKPEYKRREKAINSKGLADNRMSYGCINLKEEDYDAMHKYLGEGNKLYVLPEEKGNKLQLEKQKDGTYKFEQTYHKNDRREVSKEDASVVYYDVRPDRNPQKPAKPKKTPQKPKYAWYDPRGWFS